MALSSVPSEAAACSFRTEGLTVLRPLASRAASAATMALTVLLVLTMGSVASAQPAERPDIIVLYLDDVDPHDGRLWSDPARTPTLAGLFAEQGVRFDNAISETPLCSPGRAGTLTGLHTLNHGVDTNVAAPFDPRVTLASELGEAGYHTILVGKYLNKVRPQVPIDELSRHAEAWDEFDILYEANVRYFDYDLWDREGLTHFGQEPADHSTMVTKRRLVEHLREAPADQPVFAFASIHDLHEPNTPAPAYEGDERCRNIGRWDPPSSGADVSDKPAYVQERKERTRAGWPLKTYCEEMLGVEELASAMVREQQARGRLDDTIFILTADNGSTWGIHRLPQQKGVPYATPIPLVFSWPARWGDEAVVVDEVVSNIDLAPTLCAIGGCEMGPYPGGPETADGLSLLPLLDGEADHLERIVVREQGAPDGYGSAPRFWAIRTTSQHPLGRYHYIEYQTGETELYDSVEDPWEISNLATADAYAEVVARLAEDLRVEFPSLP